MYRKNPAKTASMRAERPGPGIGSSEPDDDADDRRERDQRHPADDLVSRGPARQQKADDADAVAEAVHDHDEPDDQAQPATDREPRRERHAVEEAVEAHARRRR